MDPRIPAFAAGLLLALVAPAGAQAAPTLDPMKPCYVTAGTDEEPQGEPVRLRAAGFTPDSRVDLTLTAPGKPVETTANLQVNSSGRLVVPKFPAPFVRSGTAQFTVTLTEQGNPANTVTAAAATSALGVGVKPQRARPSQRIRFTGLGFTADKPVYAHYLFNGRQRARVRMARRPGACGAWTVRRPQFPMRSPAQGGWVVQFDQSRRYVNGNGGRLDSVYVRLSIRIRLVPRD